MEQIVNLKQFRQITGLTQSQAAESIGIDQRQWSRYENGINEMSIKYLKAICTEHNVNASWLLGLSTNPKEENHMEKYQKLKEGIIELLQICEDDRVITPRQWEELKDRVLMLTESIEEDE